MSLLRRKLMEMKSEAPSENLAIDTDFTTSFDHLAGRKGIMINARTLMQQNHKYKVSFKVTMDIVEYNKDKYASLLLGGYGQWKNGAFFGRWDFDGVKTREDIVVKEGIYYSSDPDKWCKIDCGGMKGTVRFYDVVITEVT